MGTFELPLSQGEFAIIDGADYPLVGHYKWTLLRMRHGPSYAYRKVGGRSVLLHRVLLGDPPGPVDHIDGNGLNNRRKNLRMSTTSKNLANRGNQSNNTSGFKGVVWHRGSQLWQARIKVQGKTISLRYFKNPEEAARAYDVACREHFGDFCRPNLPDHGLGHRLTHSAGLGDL